MSNLANINDFASKDGVEIRVAQAAVKIWRGGAVGIVSGTGYATALRTATAAMQFIGVSEETSDNTAGVAGTVTYGPPLSGLSPFVRVRRSGLVMFAQTGTAITQAHMRLKVWFADDQTVTLTPGAIQAGVIAALDESGNVWIDITDAVKPLAQEGWNLLSGSTDAVPANLSASYMVTTAGVDAMTLAAPTAVVDDGKTIVISSNTANAHTLTATGLLQCGTTAVNVATFAAHPGAGLTLRAYNGKWNVISAVTITFS